MYSAAQVLDAKIEIRNWLVRQNPQKSGVAMAHPDTTAGGWPRIGRLVHAIGIGPKIVAGHATGDMAIRFHVVKKVPESLLSRKARLNKSVMGIPTDVIESPPTVVIPASVNKSTTPKPWQQEISPICGGTSVSHHAGPTGTITHVFKPSGDRSRSMVLGNNHVLANSNTGKIGDSLLHPGLADDGGSSFATLHDYEPLRFGRNIKNLMDAAIGVVNEGIACAEGIYGGATMIGPQEAVSGLRIRTQGRTSGAVTGMITDVDLDVSIGYMVNGGVTMAGFSDQIRICADPGQRFGEGDSGALVLSDTSHGIGLIFAVATDGSYAMANQLQPIMSRFGLGQI